jgi:hypothetical protein
MSVVARRFDVQAIVVGPLLYMSVWAAIAVAQPAPQVYKGFEITPLSIERTAEWRLPEGFLTPIAMITRGDAGGPKEGFEFAVVRIRIKVSEKQGKDLSISSVQVVDAEGGKHRWSGWGSKSAVTHNWGDRTEEFDFAIPKSAPKLVRLLFEDLAFDLGGLGAPAKQ